MSVVYEIHGLDVATKNFSAEDFSAQFLQTLQARRSADVRRGSTSLGAHLDDLKFFVNGRELKLFGSQGYGTYQCYYHTQLLFSIVYPIIFGSYFIQMIVSGPVRTVSWRLSCCQVGNRSASRISDRVLPGHHPALSHRHGRGSGCRCSPRGCRCRWLQAV